MIDDGCECATRVLIQKYVLKNYNLNYRLVVPSTATYFGNKNTQIWIHVIRELFFR